MGEPDVRSAAERILSDRLEGATRHGQPLSERALQRQRSVESYLRGEMLPRFIQRAVDIDRATREHRRRLDRVYADLMAEHGADREEFARRWTERVHAWNFDEVNLLIQQHNDWYPIERDLPMDPRTGDYIPVGGRSYRREPLGPDWIFQRWPALQPAPTP